MPTYTRKSVNFLNGCRLSCLGGGVVANCARTAPLRPAGSHEILPCGFPTTFTPWTAGRGDLPEGVDTDYAGEQGAVSVARL